MIKNTTVLVALMLFSPVSSMDNFSNASMLHGIELGIQEKYDQAISFFSELAAQKPQHPAPHFFLATIWQSKMMDFETQSLNDSFLVEIEKTLQLSTAQLSNDPDNINIEFYNASALAYKSFQISRQGQYINGIRLGLKAVEKLGQIVARDSSYFDAYLGIGSYLYWRSYLTRNFSWLPFFADQRERGIELVKKSFDFGTISRWAALSNLAWIYIKEERFNEAIDCAEKGLEYFPNSRFFLWPLGDAQFYEKDFSGALQTYQSLLTSVTAEDFNNHYNEIVLHLKIATCLYELGDYQYSKIHARMVLDIQPENEVKQRLKPKRKDARELLKKINSRSEPSISEIE